MITTRTDKPVAYLSGNGNYTTLHFADGDTMLVSITLSQMIAKRYPDFVRVHKRTAVNLNYVRHWHWLRREFTSQVFVWCNGEVITLAVGRRRVEGLQDQLTIAP